jgi:hypothetical protein
MRNSHGSVDVFLLTLNAGGKFVRVATLGGASLDAVNALLVTSNGSAYLVGVFQGTVDFDPGAPTQNRTSHGAFDGYVLKLKPSGAFAWVAALGGTASDTFGGASLDSAGDVYVTGQFEGTMDFDPGPASFPLTPVGGTSADAFDLELTGGGQFVDAWQMGGSATDSGIGVAALGHTVYTTGFLLGDGDYNPGPGTLTLTHVGGTFDTNGFMVQVVH